LWVGEIMGLGSYTINQRRLATKVQELKNYLSAVVKRVDQFETKKPKFVKMAVRDIEKELDGWFLNRRKTIRGIEKRILALEEEINGR